MGKTEWAAAILVGGLAAGAAWVRHRRQAGHDSGLPLWRPLVWLAGWLALLLGVVGIFLPGLPTVPFVLLAAGCWSRSSPRFHRWLGEHPRFGAVVRNWEHRRAVPLKGKVWSSLMMACSCGWLPLSRALVGGRGADGGVFGSGGVDVAAAERVRLGNGKAT